MTSLRDMSIRLKVRLAVGLVFAAALVISTSGLFYFQNRSYHKRVENQLGAFAGSLAVPAANQMRFRTPDETLQLLENIAPQSEIIQVHLFRLISAETNSPPEPVSFADWPVTTQAPDFAARAIQEPRFGITHRPDGVWLVQQLLNENGFPFARVAIRSDPRSLRQERRDAFVLLLAVALFTALISIGTALLLERALTHPLSTVTATIHRITQSRDRSLRARIDTTDEIGQLTCDFNRMLDSLEQQSNALRHSEETYRGIFGATSDALFIHDEHGTMLDVNPQMCAMFRCTREQALGSTIAQFSEGSPPYSQAEATTWVRRALESGPQVFEWHARRTNGDLLWVEVALHAAEIAGQRCVIASVRDITDRKHAEEAIQNLNQELERRVTLRTAQLQAANRELEAFSYSVSHDLRSPLRAIDGYSHILAEDYASHLDPEAQRLCANISGNARRLGQLIDDLLAFSRLGRTDLSLNTIDMDNLVQSAFEDSTANEDRSRIEFRRDPLLPAYGDERLIRQVWLNLLSNALKYSSRHDQTHIHISSRAQDNQVVYAVRDRGAGFDMQYAHKLFGVFQRLHPESEFRGTGVGLAIVKRIIDRHGGRVWAEGSPGLGATFSFSLPNRPAPPHGSDTSTRLVP